MRLHHLSVSAFGPFAGTEEIDFDELNAAGLFLLTGPTGAGKTSVLDAICFALYGCVPGARGVKTLKSQHADPETRPEVELEFSIADRRFRVRRSAEWTRPKLRGTGTKNEPASATLIELGCEETFLSSRAQEVGHLISGLIGMSASQFSQVAMLPQGEFATFLRATSQERHDVLQQLFRTDRFAMIETWVQEHSRALEKRSVVEQRDVQRILDTMADRAGVTLAESLDDDLTAAASDGRVLAWAGALVERATAQLDRTHEQRTATRSTVERVRAEHTVSTDHIEKARRRTEAEDVLARLAEHADAAESASQALRDDARAGRCRALVALVDEATATRDVARSVRDQHRTRVAGRLATDASGLTSTSLSERAQATRSMLARTETLLPRERARQEARDVLSGATGRAEALTARVERTRARVRQLPAERDALRQSLDEAAAASHQRERFSAHLEAARTKLEAARALPTLKAELHRADDALRSATDEAQTAREVMQDLIAGRLSGMASELAGSLTKGMPCQVCGSVAHPDPAAPSADAVTDQAQRRATAAYDLTSRQREESTRRAASAEKRLAAVEQAADGLDEAKASAREQELATGLAESVAAAAEADRLRQRLTDVEAELDTTTRILHTDEREVALQKQLCRNAEEVVASVTAEIAHVFPGAAADRSLAELQEEHRSLLSATEVALTACVSFERASQRLDEQTSRAMVTLEQEGFTSLDEIRACALTDTQRNDHQSLLEQRTALRTRAEAVLDELPDVEATDNAVRDDVDLTALQTALDDALRDDETAARAMHEQQAATTSLTDNLVRLDQRLSSWAPVRDEHLRAEAMSKLVRGMGGDNHLQVRLSAYVLAARLDQVVSAANERLSQMRDQRYLLERTGRTTRRGAQSGLGLDIIDEWTGDVRDPATLSGGETFVVSLSLALGLADVVSNEAGGTEMETLFIDEGFGTLDPDTLDDVMDRIDGLRDGGRTVGLVSHVGELRNRIPTQLHVDKRRSGSTVSLRALTA